MSRRRPHAGPAPTVRVAQRLRSAASPSTTDVHPPRICFEHLRCVLARAILSDSDVSRYNLGRSAPVIVRDGQVIEDVFAHVSSSPRADVIAPSGSEIRRSRARLPHGLDRFRTEPR